MKSIEKSKLSEGEILILNEQISGFYLNSIINKAVDKKNSSICNKLKKTLIDSCLITYATNLKDFNTCKIIKDDNLKIDCLNTLIKYKADSSGDLKLCETFDVSNIGNENAKKDYIESCKSDLLIQKALKENKIDICNKILNNEYKNVCLDVVKNKKQYGPLN